MATYNLASGVDVAEPPSLAGSWRTLPMGSRAGVLALGAYVVAMSIARFWHCFDPWVAETDWKQWVWQYWRHHTPGAFPAGQVITDYTFNAQPPLYHGAMALLSTLFVPVVAANLVNFVAWAAGLAACVLAVHTRTRNLVVAAAAPVLFARDDVLHRITMGGYPRSFGPTLTILFLAAWLAGRRRLALGVLVVAAALYPSVAVPCGLAIGIYTVITTPRTSLRAWLVPQAELLVAAVAIGVLAQLQSLTAPDWWGSVVWAKDAGIELTSQGRTPWLPLGPFWSKAWWYVVEPWTFSGYSTAEARVPWSEGVAHNLGFGLFVLALVVGTVRSRKIDLEPLALIVAAFVSFWLARELAFKLYLPHRMVQHIVPGAMFVAICLAWHRALASPGDRQGAASWAVVGAVLVPLIVVSGEGMRMGDGYKSYAKNAPLYQWFEKHTAVSEQVGGAYVILDEIPLFAARQPYVNWKMAHPFRKGFFDEIIRRTVRMYDAIFARTLEDVVRFGDEEHVEWLVIDKGGFEKLEQGGESIFEPMRSRIDREIYSPRKSSGFALADPPKAIVAYEHRSWRVISMKALRAWLAARNVQPTQAQNPAVAGSADGAGDDEAP